MADGVTITSGANSTPPAGTVVSTDDAGASGHVQRVKLAYSADGSAVHVPADADGLLVNLGANNDVTVTGTVTATDGGSTISVDDGAGSLTVDGTVGVSGTVTVDSELTTADLDTGAGTDTRAVVGLVGSKSGGGALIPGDATAGLKVDLGADNDVTVTGTVTANLAAGTNNIGDVDILSIAAGDNNIGNVDVVTLPSIPAGTNNIGDVDVLTLPALPAGTNNIGDVDVLSTVLPVAAGTSAVTSVNDAATNQTLLSATAARKGFRIYNDSSAILYVKYGTTASATDYTVQMAAGAYLEENFYSGRVDGIWASDASGAARITELT